MLILFLCRSSKEGKGCSRTSRVSLSISCSVSVDFALLLLFSSICLQHTHCPRMRFFFQSVLNATYIYLFSIRSFIKPLSVLTISSFASGSLFGYWFTFAYCVKTSNFLVHHSRLGTKDIKRKCAGQKFADFSFVVMFNRPVI